MFPTCRALSAMVHDSRVMIELCSLLAYFAVACGLFAKRVALHRLLASNFGYCFLLLFHSPPGRCVLQEETRMLLRISRNVRLGDLAAHALCSGVSVVSARWNSLDYAMTSSSFRLPRFSLTSSEIRRSRPSRHLSRGKPALFCARCEMILIVCGVISL